VTETVSAGRLVVITRPVDQAELLAERLKASGRQAILFPLLEIHPLENTEALKQALAGLSEFAMVAFVSPNAIDAAFAAGFCCPDGVALAVMGEGSRAALAKHGLTDVNARIFSPQNAERTDSETLLESLMFGTVKGAFTGAVDAAGLFEQAENGSLYLDEINSMGLNLQAKLLRVIQDKVVRRVGDHRNRAINCRILCSTNRDPFDAVKDREIREDLYYRLAATILFIPPLRDRQDDLAALCQFFISKYNQQFGTAITEVSPELYAILHHHSWPGNVRELEHLIESSMTLVNPEDDLLTPEHLPLFLQGKFLHQLQDHCETGSSCKLLQMLEEYEKRILKETLKKNRWNVTQTSKDLGIFRQALQYRIKRYNLAPGDE